MSRTLSYAYASAKAVAELRELKGHNRSAFALALEKLVYRDLQEDMELPVDGRTESKDRVLLIRKCLFKYYEVPEHLQEDVWNKAMHALNSLARRLQASLRRKVSHTSTDLHQSGPFGDDFDE